MNAPSVDIIDMLEDSGLGLTFKTNLFIGKEPDGPDECVTIYDTPGMPPQLTFDKEEDYSYPSIQIRVRARNYLSGYSMINNIKESLHGVGHETVNNTVYSLIKCIQEPFLLDYDEKNRARFVCNFNIQRNSS